MAGLKKSTISGIFIPSELTTLIKSTFSGTRVIPASLSFYADFTPKIETAARGGGHGSR